MKLNGLKIFKFSTFYKRINRIEDIFSSAIKNIRYVLRNIENSLISIIKYLIKDLLKIIKLINLKKIDFKAIYGFFYLRKFNFIEIRKKTKLLNYKYLTNYLAPLIIVIFVIYFSIPIFYNYDKSLIEKRVCESFNINCSIKGKISYKFFPTPRIQLKNFLIQDLQKKETWAKVEIVEAKLYIKDLLNKQKQNFKEIKFNDFEINIDVKNLDNYQTIFKKSTNLVPLNFAEGKIIFFDKKKYIASINNTNFEFIRKENSKKYLLEGIFLGDKINIDFEGKKIDGKLSSEIILKMKDFNLLTKTNFSNHDKDKNKINGNFLIKRNKNKLMGLFSYENNKIIINKSNLRNSFLEGKLEGQINLLPYFSFDLDLNLNSINFTRLHNYFLTLDKKRLFRINNKINGNLNLSSEKVYSSYNLVKTFESEIKFNNGNIVLQRFLVNLGKLGAADISGEINNNKKFTNFKYESNVFIDNKKKFLSKFGVYNKKNISSNFFISGNFNLQNLKSSFYEISGDEKFDRDDINFIEKEFNDLMLEDDYESLFNFKKFKQFIKSITTEDN